MNQLPDWIIDAKSPLADEDTDKLELWFFQDESFTDARAAELLNEISSANRLSDVKSLAFRETEITDKSMTEWAHVAQAGELGNLTSISFSDTKITDASMTEWAKAAEAGMLINLTEIQLWATQVGDGFLSEIANAVQAGYLTQLEELWLTGTEVSDLSVIGLGMAAQSGYLSRLERVAFSSTKVTSAIFKPWSVASNSFKLPNLLTFGFEDNDLESINLNGKEVSIPHELQFNGKALELFEWLRKEQKIPEDRRITKKNKEIRSGRPPRGLFG